MTHYFVDFENTKPTGKNYIDSVKEGDIVHILYSGQGNMISLDFLAEMEKRHVAIKIRATYVGTKNALDFQLSSYMGYIIGSTTRKADHYVIVSKDTGYDNLVAFWSNQGVDVKRIPTLQKGVCAVKLTVSESGATTIEELSQYLPESEYRQTILRIINDNRSKTKISNSINRLYGDNQKGSAVYTKIKPLLKKKQKI